jgi:hypothetical protein
VLLIILIAVILYAKAAPRRIEANAVRKLRSFGDAELAYHERDRRYYYGSFEALQKSGRIPANETLRNTIPKYLVTWTIPDYAEQERIERELGGVDMMVQTFTIIAYPYNPAKLHTFDITDDQIIREFSPDKGNQFDAVHSWTPVE